MAWRDIADSEVDPESPVTTSLAQAWRDNPTGIAQRDAGAPRVQPSSVDKLTGSGTWDVPSGVTRIRVWRSGGGGGGASGGDENDGSPGGDTSFGSLADAPGGVGGRAVVADENRTGNSVRIAHESFSGSPGGRGGSADTGSGFNSVGGDGSPGHLLVDTLSVLPGDSISYAVGSGGSGGSSIGGADGSQGEDGHIMVEH